jgi:TolB-like protein
MMNVEPAQSPIRPRGNGRIAAAALVVFGVAAVGAFAVYGRWSPPGGVHRLAVQPFSTLPAGAADSDVGAGFADAIVRALTGSGAITVSPTGGADTVLEGSVERLGDGTLRVEARLLRAQDGRRLWSETYDSTPSRLVEVESAVLDAVIEHLRLRLEPGERDRMGKVLRAGRPGT